MEMMNRYTFELEGKIQILASDEKAARKLAEDSLKGLHYKYDFAIMNVKVEDDLFGDES